MSAGESDQIERQALKHAALSYFRKPCQLHKFMELGRVVRQALDERERRVEVRSLLEPERPDCR